MSPHEGDREKMIHMREINVAHTIRHKADILLKTKKKSNTDTKRRYRSNPQSCTRVVRFELCNILFTMANSDVDIFMDKE